jgi:uncharacterized membrane protein
MASNGRGWSDGRVAAAISALLRVGVGTAMLVVLLGGAVYLARHGATAPDYHVFHGEPADLRDAAGIVTAARSLSGRGLIQFGLLLLIATPVARVAVSVAAFALEHDWTYVVITLVVLGVLLASLVGAAG